MVLLDSKYCEPKLKGVGQLRLYNSMKLRVFHKQNVFKKRSLKRFSFLFDTAVFLDH